MNIDGYLTEEVMDAAWAARMAGGDSTDVVRAALPGVLARHRADVLRETAPGHCPVCRDALLQEAIEAAADA